MLTRKTVALLLAAGLCPLGAAVRVVIVTGENTFAGHKWQETSAAIKEVVEKNEGVQATIAPDPNFLASNDLFGFDVAVLDFRNEKPLAKDEQARANLLKFLGQGRGLVLVHWASGAFPNWPEFANIAGRCQQRKHDVRGAFKVKIVNRRHPTTIGMQDFETDDELFFDFAGERPIQVLATAHSVKTDKDHPMAFTLQYGTARVFHTPLGHDVRALQMAGTAELIRRGTLWAAGGRTDAASKMRLVLEEFDGTHPNGKWDVHNYPGGFEFEVRKDTLVMTDKENKNQHVTRRGLLLSPKSQYAVEARFRIKQDAKPPNSFCLNYHIKGDDGVFDPISCWASNVSVQPAKDKDRGGTSFNMGFLENVFKRLGEAADAAQDWSKFDTDYRIRADVNTGANGQYKLSGVRVRVWEGNDLIHEREADYTAHPYQPDFSKPVRVGVNTHGGDWTMWNFKVYSDRKPLRGGK